jgi:hypothetical protein
MASPTWVWIKVDGNIGNRYRASLTTRREEATILSATDSEQLLRAVSDEYATYEWLSVPVVGRGRYVVEGMQKNAVPVPAEAA